MTSRQYDTPSVRQLSVVVEAMAGEVGSRRLDQLRWVVGMFHRAVGLGSMPEEASWRVDALLGPEALQVFCDLAEQGELRARVKDRGKPLTLATRDVVWDCLRILGDRVTPGRELWLPSLPQAAPRAVSTPEQEGHLFRFLVDLAGQQPVGHDGQSKTVNADYRVRLLAMAGVVLDTRSRRGELAGMRMKDLGEGLADVRVVRRPQNGAHLEPVEVRLPLSESTVTALRRWLRVRERLVYPLEGAADALWVSVASSNRGEPPGLPLAAESLGASYTRGVRILNSVMAGQPGWEPLPDRLEGLRRAWLPPEEARVREERAAAQEAAKPRRPRGGPRLPADRPILHGREYSYNDLKCRCDECREAATNARQARAAARRERLQGG